MKALALIDIAILGLALLISYNFYTTGYKLAGIAVTVISILLFLLRKPKP